MTFKTFLLLEDLTHTNMNDIYVMASVHRSAEEYGARLYNLTTKEIIKSFMRDAWPEILTVIGGESIYIKLTKEYRSLKNNLLL